MGPKDLEVVLPAARYDDELVPDYVFDRSPEYMIVGGLIFQPLTTSYLRSWGKEWWKSAPYRMTYYTYEKATPERPQLVILSHLLPDRFNLGYQELAYMALDKVNGRTISSIRSLADALKRAQDPAAFDKIIKIQNDLDDTTAVLHQTIDNLLERGEKLDNLVERSDDLSKQSKMFYKQARKTNSCCVIS